MELDYSDYKAEREQILSINSPRNILPHLEFIRNEEQENFVVVSLTSANTVINTTVITKGLVNSTQVHPREVFRQAIKDNAVGIIVAHNHPSGNITASPQDLKVTDLLLDASKIIGIELLDHIIVSSKGWLSIKAEGDCRL